MAFPLEFHETFEAGTLGNFTSKTDPDERIGFPHQRDLWPVMPYRGGYCCRIDVSKTGSSDTYIERTVSWATGQTRWGRFRLFIGEDLQFGNDGNSFKFLQFYSGAPGTEECGFVIARVDPLGICFVAESQGEVVFTDNSLFRMPVGKWITIEFKKYCETSSGNAIAILPNVCNILTPAFPEGTITRFRFGSISPVGDIRGTIYIDDVMVDEDRLWEDPSGYNGHLSGESLFFLQSGFAFLGPGRVEQVKLIGGNSGDCRIRVYDTDEPVALPAYSLRDEIVAAQNTTNEGRSRLGFTVQRGAYVQLSGTNPQAIIRLGGVSSDKAWERADG